MIYAILKVKLPEELADMLEMDAEYFIVNNRYVGYVDVNHFDRIRQMVVMTKSERYGRDLFRDIVYTPLAIITPDNSDEEDKLRSLFIGGSQGIRTLMTKEEVCQLVRGLANVKTLKEKTYKVYFPNRNSSRVVLKEEGSSEQVEDFTELLYSVTRSEQTVPHGIGVG